MRWPQFDKAVGGPERERRGWSCNQAPKDISDFIRVRSQVVEPAIGGPAGTRRKLNSRWRLAFAGLGGRQSWAAPEVADVRGLCSIEQLGQWGLAMLSWLRRRRERVERIDAKATALNRAFGVDAYSVARQRKLQAESTEAAQEWRRVARVIAQKTGTRAGLGTATRMAVDADFTAARQKTAREGTSIQLR